MNQNTSKFLVLSFCLALSSLSGCTCGPQCTAGAQSCACREGATCADGLACNAANVCVPPVAAGVQIDAAARGCEVLLTESAGSTVLSASFKNGVKGTFIRQAPKVALTFVSGGDTAIGGNVELGLGGPASGLTVTKSSCVDLKGQRLTSTVSVR